MQDSPSFDKPFLLKSIVICDKCKAVHSSGKLKPLRYVPSKTTNKPMYFMYDFLIQDGITFRTRTFFVVPYYWKEPLIFRQIESYKEKSFKFVIYGSSDTIQTSPILQIKLLIWMIMFLITMQVVITMMKDKIFFTIKVTNL